jgi:hypothetical protein
MYRVQNPEGYTGISWIKSLLMTVLQTANCSEGLDLNSSGLFQSPYNIVDGHGTGAPKLFLKFFERTFFQKFVGRSDPESEFYQRQQKKLDTYLVQGLP